MLGFLAGLPGQIATLTTRLSQTWADKLTAIHTPLIVGTRMANLDNLNTTISSRAAPSDLTPLAKDNNPRFASATTIDHTAAYLTSGEHGFAYYTTGLAVTAFTMTGSWATVFSHTGSGIVDFFALQSSSNAGTTSGTIFYRVTIDGVTVINTSVAVSSLLAYKRAIIALVGAVMNRPIDSSWVMYPFPIMASGQTYKSSFLVEAYHSGSTIGTGWSCFRSLRRMS